MNIRSLFQSVCNFIKRYVHKTMLVCSKEYSRKVDIDMLIEQLRKEVARSAHASANVYTIGDILDKLALLGGNTRQALDILSNANNFDHMDIAVYRDPRHYGSICADKLMETAREHLKLFGHQDHAYAARKRLTFARKWYYQAGRDSFNSSQLFKEIEDGLKKVDWIFVN